MKIKDTLIITLVFILEGILCSCSSFEVVETETNSKIPLLIYTKGDVYKQEWRHVDSLEQNGLTKSALTEVQAIYKKAEEEDNHEQ